MRRLLLKAILLLVVVTIAFDKAQGQAINPDGGRRPDAVMDSIQPFQIQLSISLPEDETDGIDEFIVPAGKRLIIEYVSALVNLPPEQNVVVFHVNTTVGGELVTHILNPMNSGSLSRFFASQQVRLYADPETFVTFRLVRGGITSVGGATIGLSGRLVDLP